MGLPGSLDDWKTVREWFPPGTVLYAVWDPDGIGDRAVFHAAKVEKVTSQGIWITGMTGKATHLGFRCRRIIQAVEAYRTKQEALTAALDEADAELVAAQEKRKRIELLKGSL